LGGELVSSETGKGGGKLPTTTGRTLKGTLQTLLLRRANEGLLPYLHNIAKA